MMKEEEKQLLFIDLCGRLPYGVKVEINGVISNPLGCELIGVLGKAKAVYVHLIPAPTPIDEVKPYLRPMSSMTSEEKEELKSLKFIYHDGHITNESIGFDNEHNVLVDEVHCSFVIDWLKSHHLDFRGLIEKGLALEAPKEMYKL